MPVLFAPPELASRWGISPEKVIAWIRNGELRAIDASSRRGQGRPRFLIDEADIAAFERSREVVPVVKSTRRKRRPPGLVRHFR